MAANRSASLRVDRAVSTQALASQLALVDDTVSAQTPTAGTLPTSLGDVSWTLQMTEAEPPLVPLIRTTLTVSYHGHETHVVTDRRSAQPE